ncbi:MAG TPA: M56 family metallopeptidase [Candidatus Solibacter sp.]|nr:M56 family metallopeptidase [Candidatus Solibacter sp.]
MFDLRGVLVSLGFFGVVYCLLSLLVVCCWRGVARFTGLSSRATAHLLFGLRIFPFTASLLLTLAFGLPAFLLLEGGGVDEDWGTLVFCTGSLLLLSAGVFRAITAHAQTARIVSEWTEGASALDTGTQLPTLQVRPGIPSLLLCGICKPTVLVSETAVAMLSRNELRIALGHEIEHLRVRDNLKKLFVYTLPFPGMSGLERSWHESAELAADDAAVTSRVEAVDLAAALVKLSALAPVAPTPAFTTGLVNAPTPLNHRVERLLSWSEQRLPGRRCEWWYLCPPLSVLALCAAVEYGRLLLLTHRATEWFVR